MKPIIEVDNISKLYHLGVVGTTTLRESVEQFWLNLQGKKRKDPSKPFWALKNVSFSVNQGEIVGLIGKNGAGKSTLLKILSKITEPTSGRAVLRGRVSSLLEVGTGFHPDLTGRENVYLNGAILGMRKAEIDNKFDEIVSFAEVEKFIDTPVKHYSSGMYVRLAFAVAAHLEPEILLVDEVLAVGDMNFQRKCLNKMDEISKAGRTILFISHNMNAITRLCPKSLFFNNGCLVDIGGTNNIVVKYLSAGANAVKAIPRKWMDVSSFRRAAGRGEVRFEAFRHNSENETVAYHPYPDGPVFYEVILSSDIRKSLNNISIVHFDTSGTKLANAHTLSISQSLVLNSGKNRILLKVENLHLNPGIYQVGLWVADFSNIPFDYVEPCIEIEVIEDTSRRHYVKPQGDGLVTCNVSLVECKDINDDPKE